MRQRKRENWKILCFQYGVLGSFHKDIPPFLIEEAQKMTETWNKLVSLEKKYREKYQTQLEEMPEIKVFAERVKNLEKEIEEVNGKIKDLRKKLRKRTSPEIQALKEKQKELERVLKEVRKEKRKLEKENREKAKYVWDELFEEARKIIKNSGLFWANREVIWDRFITARKIVRQRGGELKFRKFDGNWSLTMRFPSGISVGEAFRKIFDRKPSEKDYSIKSKRQRNKALKVHLRFSQGRGKEVFIPIILHRPLPEEAFIKRIVLVRRQYGPDGFAKYFVSFAIEVPPDWKESVPENRKKLVVLESGFRKVGEDKVEVRALYYDEEEKKLKRIQVVKTVDRIRVGVLYDGKVVREICLPPNLVAKFEVAREKKAEADRILENLKKDLFAFFIDLKQNAPEVSSRLPGEIFEMIKTKAVWGRVRKRGLRKIVSLLRGNGIFKDVADEIEETIRLYDKKVSISVRSQRKAVGHRKKFYEKLAKDLYSEYETVVFPELDLAVLSRKERAEELPDKARYQRTIAGLSVLRNCLEWKAEKTGSKFYTAKFENKNKFCYKCGAKIKPDLRKQFRECPHCGAEWDVDENAAINIFREAADLRN